MFLFLAHTAEVPSLVLGMLLRCVFSCFGILALFFVFRSFCCLDCAGIFVLLAGPGGGACGRGEVVTGGTPTAVVGACKIGFVVMVFWCGARTIGNGLGEDEGIDIVVDMHRPDGGDGVVDEEGGGEGVVADGFAVTTGADGRRSSGSGTASAIGREAPVGTFGCSFDIHGNGDLIQIGDGGIVRGHYFVVLMLLFVLMGVQVSVVGDGIILLGFGD